MSHVIEFTVDDKELIERLAGRFACAKCGALYNDASKKPVHEDVCDSCGGTEFTRREDDKAKTVARRLETYHQHTAPLLPYYAKKKLLRQVDGMADIAEVTNQIDKILLPAYKN